MHTGEPIRLKMFSLVTAALASAKRQFPTLISIGLGSPSSGPSKSSNARTLPFFSSSGRTASGLTFFPYGLRSSPPSSLPSSRSKLRNRLVQCHHLGGHLLVLLGLAGR